MKAGHRIRVLDWYRDSLIGTNEYVVEEFRHCLGIFESGAHREAGRFTPLCELYEPGPDSEERYIGNFGNYHTNEVQAWIDLGPTEELAGLADEGGEHGSQGTNGEG